MRTTITLDEGLVAAVKEVTRERTKTRAITSALTEFVRRKKLDDLRSLLGNIQVDEEAVAEMERSEMKVGE